MNWVRTLLFTAIVTPVLLISSDTKNDIKGYVKDFYTGESLPYTNVGLLGTGQGTSSNTDGYFVIVNAPVGACSLFVSYIGYEPVTFPITNVPAKTEAIIIELKRKAIDLTEVEVVADAYEVFKSSDNISQMTISPRELQTLPSLGEVDIFRSLQLLPGISGVSDGKTGGGTPDQNMVILDGMTVYHVDHFFGMFSAFNADAIKDVQIYKGGFPAKYGGRLSSVVELTGKRGGGSFQQEVVPSFYFYDFNTKLALNPTDSDFFSLSIYAGRDYLDKSRELNMGNQQFSTSSGTQFETRVDENLTDWGNLGGSFKWGHQWEKRGFSNL